MILTSFTHLKPAEFIDLLEGVSLSPSRRSHLESCSRCRLQLDAIAPLYQELGATERAETWTQADWQFLREGVRNGLLGRAASRGLRIGRAPRWPVPRMAWGLTLVLLASVLALTSLWGLRTGEPARPGVETATGVDPSLAEDDVVLETEAISWPQTDIFSELAELEPGQQEALREMIRLSLAEGTSPE